MRCGAPSRSVRDDALYQNTLGTVLAEAGELRRRDRALRRCCELAAGPRDRLVQPRRAADALRAPRRSGRRAAAKPCALAPDHVAARALLADTLRVERSRRRSRRGIPPHHRRAAVRGHGLVGLADLKTTQVRSEPTSMRMRAALARSARERRRSRSRSASRSPRRSRIIGRYAESLAALDARERDRARAHGSGTRPRSPRASTRSRARSRRRRRGAAEHARRERHLHRQPAALGIDADRADPRLALRGRRRRRAARPAARARRGIAPARPCRFRAGSARCDAGRLGAPRPALSRAHRALARGSAASSPTSCRTTGTTIGAIRAMLPGARIVGCRRDPLETCFSCYRQFLYNNEYQRTFDRSRRVLARLRPHPAALRSRSITRTCARASTRSCSPIPKPQIRALLAFCGAAVRAGVPRVPPHRARRALAERGAGARAAAPRHGARAALRRAARSAAGGAGKVQFSLAEAHFSRNFMTERADRLWKRAERYLNENQIAAARVTLGIARAGSATEHRRAPDPRRHRPGRGSRPRRDASRARRGEDAAGRRATDRRRRRRAAAVRRDRRGAQGARSSCISALARNRARSRARRGSATSSPSMPKR